MRYVNNMSYVKLYALRHELCKYMSIFMNHLKSKKKFSQHFRINLRHQKY